MTTRPGPAVGHEAGADRTAPADRPDRQPRQFDPGPAWMRYLPPAAALGLSFWGITTPSYWRDEAATLAAIRRPFGDLVTMLGNVDAVHALYYMIMWVLLRLAGSAELAMRFPSALAIAAAAAAVAATGRRLISPQAGLAAGLLFAVLPVASRYGQEARSYAMVIAVAATASYLLVRLTGAEAQRRRRWLVAYGLSLIALGVLNIFALLIIPAHAITVGLWYRRAGDDPARRRLAAGWLVAVAAALVVSGPQLALGWMQRHQIGWLAVNKSSSGPGTLITLIGSRLLTLLAVVVIALAAVVSVGWGQTWRRAAWPAALFELSLPWLILPPALLLTASLITPVYTTRYVLLCIPALALIGGAAIAALGRIGGTAAGRAPGGAGAAAGAGRMTGTAAVGSIVAAAALLGIALAGLPNLIANRGPAGHYDDIRALDRYVAAHAGPGDVLLYTNPNAESFGAAYAGGLATLRNIELQQGPVRSGTLAGTNVGPPVLRQRLALARRVWVVEINAYAPVPKVQGLNGRPLGPAFGSLPFRRTVKYRARGDWLLLFVRA